MANTACHYQTTGPEIWHDLPEVDLVVGGLGTGGTICGVAKYLKAKNPKIKVLAVDPVGSIVYDYYKTGQPGRPRLYQIEGIGEDFIPKNYDLSLIDDMVQVNDEISFSLMKRLIKEEGILAGASSGAALAGALKYLDQNRSYKNILIIVSDGSSRYMAKIANNN